MIHHITDGAGIVHIAKIVAAHMYLQCKPTVPYTIPSGVDFDDDEPPTCVWCGAGRRFK
jgi:hypothetical protein